MKILLTSESGGEGGGGGGEREWGRRLLPHSWLPGPLGFLPTRIAIGIGAEHLWRLKTQGWKIKNSWAHQRTKILKKY